MREASGAGEQTYYRSRRECEGIKVDHARKGKELDRQNAWFKKLLVESELDKVVPREAPALAM